MSTRCFQSHHVNNRRAFGGYAWAAGDESARPPLLTREIYERRAAQFESKQKATYGSMGVVGRSTLCQLPYFDIIEHTLLDMMHITEGVVGSHLVNLIKGGRMPSKPARVKDTPLDLHYALVPNPDDPRRIKDKPTDEAGLTQLMKKNVDMFLSYSRLAAQTKQELSAAGRKDSDLTIQVGDRQGVNKDYLWSQAVDAFMATQFNHFRINLGDSADLKCLEQAYTSLQLPSHVAPAAKAPFQRSGQLTAHHWVNFAKVYGKYLLAHLPMGTRMTAGFRDSVRDVLDLMALCLHPVATKAVKAWTDGKVEDVLDKFEAEWPSTEHALVLHLLVFHMPRTIQRWGPVRHYWCFPFERMIGKLASTIKSRKHPEVNLVNRYLLSIATAKFDTVAAGDSEYQQAHPLTVPAYAVNSDTQADCVLQFPAHEKKRHVSMLTDIVTDHVRQRVYVHMLGVDVAAVLGQRLSSQHEIIAHRSKVRVGRWAYGCTKLKAARQTKGDSRWFNIRAKHVPHLTLDLLQQHARSERVKERAHVWRAGHPQTVAEEARTSAHMPDRRRWVSEAEWADGNMLVYGCIDYFATMRIVGCTTAEPVVGDELLNSKLKMLVDGVFRLAKVDLYLSLTTDAWGYPALLLQADKLRYPLHPEQHDCKDYKFIEWVPVHLLEAPVGVAPAPYNSNEWVVLPLEACC